MLIESAGVGVQWRGSGGHKTRDGSLPLSIPDAVVVRNGVDVKKGCLNNAIIIT